MQGWSKFQRALRENFRLFSSSGRFHPKIRTFLLFRQFEWFIYSNKFCVSIVVQLLNLNNWSHNKYKDVIARVEASKCNKNKVHQFFPFHPGTWGTWNHEVSSWTGRKDREKQNTRVTRKGDLVLVKSKMVVLEYCPIFLRMCATYIWKRHFLESKIS